MPAGDLSADEARRIPLAAQGCDRPRPRQVAALRALAAWLGLESVAAERRGGLARFLVAALGA